MLVATPPRMKMDGSWIIVQTPTFYENKIIESSIKDANIHPCYCLLIPKCGGGQRISPTATGGIGGMGSDQYAVIGE